MWSATFEAANVRHEHEWRVWQNSKIPEQKILMPGVEINLFRRPVAHGASVGRSAMSAGADDLVRPAAGRWKIGGCSANEEPSAGLKSSALDSACTALSPNGTLKLSLIFGRESPLHPGPR